MGSGWVKWVAVGFFSLLAPAVVLGQTTGSISGVVKDTTGGVLPGVEVTLTHVATGQAREVVTDDEGRYSATNLAIGTYEVKAVLAGFQASVHRGIVLTIGREAVVDMVMQVGEISEQVTVTGDAPLVETRTSQVSGLVELRQIQNLPLNGRDFSQLVTLQAGVATPPVTRNAFGGSRQKLSIAGGRPSQNTFLLDGTDINSPRWNATPGGAAGVLLGVETVSEFTVLTNAFSTEYGNAGAGVISSVTKSGTNEIHGSAFWYHRNSALDAKNFFDDPDEPIPPFRRHQFGGTVGGPIVKNKAFFFGSYEGLRQALGITSTLRVPSPNARRGFLV
ncbi:MAG: TonB-dependent receptor, partial [Acidobacteria bacterium]|nr:TonB-dependent receptor [Acidobacteriota bacterium]